MAKFTMEEAKLRMFVDISMREGARVAVDHIIDLTPRDRNRPPKNIDRKDGKKPYRRDGVVSRGGHYYPAVSGNLQGSVGYEKAGAATYDLGVRQGPASRYAKRQEFGYGVHTPPRPYVRRGFIEGIHDIIASVLHTFYQLTKGK